VSHRVCRKLKVYLRRRFLSTADGLDSRSLRFFVIENACCHPVVELFHAVAFILVVILRRLFRVLSPIVLPGTLPSSPCCNTRDLSKVKSLVRLVCFFIEVCQNAEAVCWHGRQLQCSSILDAETCPWEQIQSLDCVDMILEERWKAELKIPSSDSGGSGCL